MVHGCATCHVDPSGADLLTAVRGRAGEPAARDALGHERPDGVATGAVSARVAELPEWLRVGGQLRDRVELAHVDGERVDSSLVLIQSDIVAACT